jgi:hypothetical protein
LRCRVAEKIEAWLESDIAAGARAAEWVQADLVTDGELAAYLRWRCRPSPVSCGDPGRHAQGDRASGDPSVQRPTARSWIEGSDLHLLSEAADRLEVCFYERVPPPWPPTSSMCASASERRRLNAVLRPTHPDLAGGTETVAAVRACARQVWRASPSTPMVIGGSRPWIT